MIQKVAGQIASYLNLNFEPLENKLPPDLTLFTLVDVFNLKWTMKY